MIKIENNGKTTLLVTIANGDQFVVAKNDTEAFFSGDFVGLRSNNGKLFYENFQDIIPQSNSSAELVGKIYDLIKDPGATSLFFGTEGGPGVVGLQSGSVFDFDTGGYNTIGFHLVPPTAGQVKFLGSYDGVNFHPMVLFAKGTGKCSDVCSEEGDFIGSITCYNTIRIETDITGNSNGSVIGNVTREIAISEGSLIAGGSSNISPPPHLIGFPIFHQDFVKASIGTSTIFTPSAGKRFVITSYHFTAAENGGSESDTILIFEETSNQPLFKGKLKKDRDYALNISNSVFVSTVADKKLQISCNSSLEISGVVHGYEID